MPSDEHRPSLADRTVLISQSDFMMTEEQIVRRATLDDLYEEFFRRHLRTQGLGLRRVRHSDMVSEYRNFSVIGDREERLAPALFGMLAFGREPQRFPRMQLLVVRNTGCNGTGRGSGVLLAGEGTGRLEEQVEIEHGVFVIRLFNRGAGTSLRRP